MFFEEILSFFPASKRFFNSFFVNNMKFICNLYNNAKPVFV